MRGAGSQKLNAVGTAALIGLHEPAKDQVARFGSRGKKCVSASHYNNEAFRPEQGVCTIVAMGDELAQAHMPNGGRSRGLGEKTPALLPGLRVWLFCHQAAWRVSLAPVPPRPSTRLHPSSCRGTRFGVGGRRTPGVLEECLVPRRAHGSLRRWAQASLGTAAAHRPRRCGQEGVGDLPPLAVPIIAREPWGSRVSPVRRLKLNFHQQPAAAEGVRRTWAACGRCLSAGAPRCSPAPRPGSQHGPAPASRTSARSDTRRGTCR